MAKASVFDAFAVLGLPRQLHYPASELQGIYDRAVAACHPDRYRLAPQWVQRAAAQRCTLLHNAYQTLKNPIRCAQHWLGLVGIATDTAWTAAALQVQMEWLERVQQGECLESELSLCETENLARLAQSLAAADWTTVLDALRALRCCAQVRAEGKKACS